MEYSECGGGGDCFFSSLEKGTGVRNLRHVVAQGIDHETFALYIALYPQYSNFYLEEFRNEMMKNGVIWGDHLCACIISRVLLMNIVFIENGQVYNPEDFDWSKPTTIFLEYIRETHFKLISYDGISVFDTVRIPQFMRRFITNRKEHDCPICREKEGRTIELACKHTFHPTCLASQITITGMMCCCVCKAMSVFQSEQKEEIFPYLNCTKTCHFDNVNAFIDT